MHAQVVPHLHLEQPLLHLMPRDIGQVVRGDAEGRLVEGANLQVAGDVEGGLDEAEEPEDGHGEHHEPELEGDAAEADAWRVEHVAQPRLGDHRVVGRVADHLRARTF